MSHSDWPTDERPRERLLAHGANSLSDAELLAIFLRTGTAGMPVMALARHLTEAFGGLRGLMTASRRQFCDVKGLGTAKYAQVQAAMEMARRVMDEPLRQGTHCARRRIPVVSCAAALAPTPTRFSQACSWITGIG